MSATSGGSPRLCIVNGLNPSTSAELYEDLADRLRDRAMSVDVFHGGRIPAGKEDRYDLLFSNLEVNGNSAPAARVVCGRAISRPASLGMMEAAAIPTMRWTLAHTRREVHSLFDRWRTSHLLLKRSFTFGGNGVEVFSKRAVWRLRWQRDLDVLCEEVNEEDGDIYKAELLNGRVLITWRSEAPPIRSQFTEGLLRGLKGAYGQRSLWDAPAALRHKLEAMSETLTENGLGHVSVDFMRRPDGEFVAIELNPRGVATWWTKEHRFFRENYADAVAALAEHSSSAAHAQRPHREAHKEV